MDAAATVCGAVRSRRGDGDGSWLQRGEGKGAATAGWLQAVRCRSRIGLGAADGWSSVEDEKFGESEVTVARAEIIRPLPRAFFGCPRRLFLCCVGQLSTCSARTVPQFGVKLPVTVPIDARDFPGRVLSTHERCSRAPGRRCVAEGKGLHRQEKSELG